MKVKLVFNRLVLLFLMLFTNMMVQAQTQGFATATRPFNFACARSDFNSFNIKFRWQPPWPEATNKFYVELSNANGSFANPVVLKEITNQNIAPEVSVNISFPANTSGKKYRIRVRSTNPAKEIIVKDAGGGEEFEAYYASVTSPLVLNGRVANVSLCPGHSKELAAQPSTAGAYRWYKDNVLIAGATTSKYTVSAAGTYYVEVEYGRCSGSYTTRSNNVVVTVGGASTVNLSASATEICSSESFTLTANLSDPSYKYTWLRNGTKIGETTGQNTYTVSAPNNAAGKYSVEIDTGSGGSCTSRSNEVEIKHKDGFTASIKSDSGDVIMPGKQKTLTAETTAQTPTYKWFKDGTEITGATAATYQATAAGKYKVEVSQSGSCAGSATAEYEIKAPSSFKVSAKMKTAYQHCTYDKITLTVDKIVATAGASELTIDPADYSSFTFQWQYNGGSGSTFTDVAGATTEDLERTSATQNGLYRLKVGATGFPAIPESNELDLQLVNTDALKINGGAANLEFCDDTVTLTVTTGATPAATYTWYKDNVKVAQGMGMTSYNTNASGVYYVAAGSSGSGCPATSNLLVVLKRAVSAEFNPAVNTKEIFFPTKATSLAVSYRMATPTIEWKKDGNVLTGETSAQLNITSAGIYQVKLTDTGDCAGKSIELGPVYYEEINKIAEVKMKTLPSTDCETRQQTTLELQKIVVELTSGDKVEVNKSDFQYFTLQWTKDGNDIAGATSRQLVVPRAGNADAAQYAINVKYGTLVKTSTPKTISFEPIPDFEVSTPEGTKGTVYLCEGGTLTLTVAPTSFDPEASAADSYSYQWYEVTSSNYTNDTPVGNETYSLVVTKTAEYYLEINNGGCPKRAHIKVAKYVAGGLKIRIVSATASVTIHQSSSQRERTLQLKVGQKLEALGGNKFVWVKQSDNSMKYGSILEITSEDMAGSYVLKEDSCPSAGTNELPFEIKIYTVDKLPNIVTPNGDGINDTWEIPEKYISPNIKVTIYSPEGKEVLSTTNYQNNWPNENTFKDLGNRALIYIYTIKGGDADEKGTITILR
ncbi:gliding motility-associated C-terminal domain-containing protein [Capnocytophaga haemolytica]|uniref:Gliding motility-associated C-terminal domain n=1 Tax=Capnocytophaga haemolytica TaxID=45243 RepID=A0AAX2H0D2_9FLAO|nr:gliding motility-associated C-terminal domain-containing protein [Capnocytophaga haemolytica]AMD85871.1 hypothetical protein AXF12_10320 [Capnocytophaga haemolytica]SFO04290.1 gliding motility-associated C-terminal domain-containing protein [Capnocytophaga haemolytica]SNV15494.1 gliding motility-associated C-terminal domain [Capnocytophaga haemolytica]